MDMMGIPDNVPETETIEEYYKRCGLVYDPIQARKKGDDDEDAEDCFYRQMGFYAQ